MSSSAFPRALPAPRQAFEVDTSLDRLPVDDVWDWLHTKAYWQRQRTRQQFEQQLRSAHLCFAVYDTSRAADELVGFARVVGDGVAGTANRLAYLADVFILEQYRSQGLGTPFMRIILNEDGRKQWRWLLHANIAESWYQQKFDFMTIGSTVRGATDNPVLLMERDASQIYSPDGQRLPEPRPDAAKPEADP